MDQKVSIFSSQMQNGQTLKNQIGSESPPPQSDTTFAAFADLIIDATQTKPLRIMPDGMAVQVNSLSNLEQQIIDLSRETESFIAVAVKEQSGPEAVEDILAHAVEQLWTLIEEFDVQNGTNHALEMSESILQVTPKSEIAEGLHNIFAQPINQSVLEASTSDVKTTVNGEEVQSHAFSQMTAKISETALFGPILNLLPKPVQQNTAPLFTTPQVHTATSAQQSLTLNTKTKPIELFTPIAANTRLLTENQLIPFKTVTQAASELQQKMHQLTIEVPQAKLTTENTLSSLPTMGLVDKTNSLATPFTGGIDVKAKTNVLLKEFAQAIVSNTSTPIILQEEGSLTLQTKSELLQTSSAHQSEQTRPTNNFSQNLANQIQGKSLNEGLTRIELAPRGLGNIIIDLQTQESGELKIMLRVENTTVLHALRTDREALLSVLSGGNVSSEDITLDFEDFNQGQFNRKNAELHQDQNTHKLDAENEDAEDAAVHSSAKKPALKEGQIDILT